MGGDFRRGALDVDGRESSAGVIVMRTGENAMAVIQRREAKNRADFASLPPGVSIKPFLRPQRVDRADD